MFVVFLIFTQGSKRYIFRPSVTSLHTNGVFLLMWAIRERNHDLGEAFSQPSLTRIENGWELCITKYAHGEATKT